MRKFFLVPLILIFTNITSSVADDRMEQSLLPCDLDSKAAQCPPRTYFWLCTYTNADTREGFNGISRVKKTAKAKAYLECTHSNTTQNSTDAMCYFSGCSLENLDGLNPEELEH